MTDTHNMHTSPGAPVASPTMDMANLPADRPADVAPNDNSLGMPLDASATHARHDDAEMHHGDEAHTGNKARKGSWGEGKWTGKVDKVWKRRNSNNKTAISGIAHPEEQFMETPPTGDAPATRTSAPQRRSSWAKTKEAVMGAFGGDKHKSHGHHEGETDVVHH